MAGRLSAPTLIPCAARGAIPAAPHPGMSEIVSTEVTSQSATTLDALPVGQSARVRRVGGPDSLRRRLMEMGLVSGALILLVRTAPLGDPLQIRVRGYDLALRRAEARLVELVVTSQDSP